MINVFYDLIINLNEMAYLGDPKLKEKGEKQIRYLTKDGQTSGELIFDVSCALQSKIIEMQSSPALLGPVNRFYKKFPKFKKFLEIMFQK